MSARKGGAVARKPERSVAPRGEAERQAQARLQCVIELAADCYWEQDWRRAHRGVTTPEDQLWRAATALVEIDDALGEQMS